MDDLAMNIMLKKPPVTMYTQEELLCINKGSERSNSFVGSQKGGEVLVSRRKEKMQDESTHLVLCPAKLEQGICVFIGDHAKLVAS